MAHVSLVPSSFYADYLIWYKGSSFPPFPNLLPRCPTVLAPFYCDLTTMTAPAASYPLAGFVYFLAHPQLWPKVLCPFILTLLVGIASLVLSFVFLLPLQAHALINAKCPVWLAWLVSVIFVLLESVVIDLLAFAIITPIYIDMLFDKTLKVRGMRRMFDTRVKVHDALVCCRGVTAGVIMLWFLLIAQVIVLLLTLPLHLIPVIGTVIACYINGWVACWGHHIHYDLEFRGWTVAESRRYAWQRKSEYASFGAVAVGLELIPIFNLFFMWTNAVGAALWVADQYEENERSIASQSPSIEGLLSPDPYGRTAPPTAAPSAATLYPDESTHLVHKK